MSSPIGSRRLTPRRQAILGLLWLALGYPASPAQGQPSAIELEQLFNGDPVLVLPFRNISGDPEVEWVGEGIAAALTAALAQTVELVDRGSITTGQRGLGLTEATRIDATEPLAMWRRVGARWVIYGAYQQLGAQRGHGERCRGAQHASRRTTRPAVRAAGPHAPKSRRNRQPAKCHGRGDRSRTDYTETRGGA